MNTKFSLKKKTLFSEKEQFCKQDLALRIFTY